MKVKELIETLQKQNPDDEVHIWVDDEVGCGSDYYKRYHASTIIIDGHDTYYMDDDGDMNDLDQIEEMLVEENDMEEISTYELYNHIERNYKPIEGLWITIKP